MWASTFVRGHLVSHGEFVFAITVRRNIIKTMEVKLIIDDVAGLEFPGSKSKQ